MKPFLFLTSLLLSSVAFGNGKVVGNGGDAVVCGKSVQVLDVYEALALRGFKLDLGAPALSVNEKVSLAIGRIKKVDPYRAALIEILSRNFFTETKFIRGGNLRDVDDSDEIFLPEGCTRKQLAIQNARVVFSDPFYTVNEDIWDRLDNDNKAALILHEVIFRGSKGAWPSPMVRFLSSMAFTNFLDKKTKFEYYEYVHGTALKDTLNAGDVGGGLWYYQMPNIRPSLDHFWDAETWGLSDAGKNWDYMCRMKFSGRPVKSDELPKIYQLIKEQYDWGNLSSPFPSRSIVALDLGQPALYSVTYSGKIQKLGPATQKKGEIWCAGNQFPLSK